MFESFDEWLRYGYNKGWCGPDVCYSYDGLPSSVEDDAACDDGGDRCVYIIRLYEDWTVKASVEEDKISFICLPCNLVL